MGYWPNQRGQGFKPCPRLAETSRLDSRMKKLLSQQVVVNNKNIPNMMWSEKRTLSGFTRVVNVSRETGN